MARMVRKLEREPGSSRRNPGRGDGLRWRSSAYISPQKVDHDDAPEEDEVQGTTYAKAKDATTAEEEEYAPRADDRVVCLMDIAKPAKQKIKKHRFQAVARSESVMSFSDIGDLESVMTEEWEALSELCEEDETFSVIGEEEGEGEGAEREGASGNKQYAEVVKEVDKI